MLWQSASKEEGNIRDLHARYPFISTRILQGSMTDITLNFLGLRQKLQSEVAPYDDSFALYFEYLPTGTTIGINENSEFTAASLLKVPVVMAYYYKKERLGLTDDPIVTIKKSELNSQFGDLYKRGAGAQINLGDAVK